MIEKQLNKAIETLKTYQRFLKDIKIKLFKIAHTINSIAESGRLEMDVQNLLFYIAGQIFDIEDDIDVNDAWSIGVVIDALESIAFLLKRNKNNSE